MGPDKMAGDTLSPADDVAADVTDGSASQPPAKKRRTGASSGSRGVANLTPEQLARKRANDREAQRAIRERTKNQIDALNRRIQDLESQQPYHDLQLVLREKDQVLAELQDVRKRLESIVSIATPALRNGLSGMYLRRMHTAAPLTLIDALQNWPPPPPAHLCPIPVPTIPSTRPPTPPSPSARSLLPRRTMASNRPRSPTGDAPGRPRSTTASPTRSPT